MTTAYWRRKERLYSNCGLELGLEIGSFNPSRLQPTTKELSLHLRKASEETNKRASNRGTKIQNTVKVNLKAIFDTFSRSCNG